MGRFDEDDVDDEGNEVGVEEEVEGGECLGARTTTPTALPARNTARYPANENTPSRFCASRSPAGRAAVRMYSFNFVDSSTSVYRAAMRMARVA